MLKTRIIGVLVIKDGIVVQSIGFNKYLPVGKPEIAVEYFNKWGIDEIAILDISATPAGRAPEYQKLKHYSRYCHVPLAVGGGISKLEDIENLVRSGADKVIINSAFHDNHKLIKQGSEEFGNQCMIVSIDATVKKGKYTVCTHSGTVDTGLSPAEVAVRVEDNGAGEIFLNSIDNDGMKCGYDLRLLESVIDAVEIPVIICGGACSPEHLMKGIYSGASAVAVANFFHFTEHSIILQKTLLKIKNAGVRLDTYAEYENIQLGEDGRCVKMPDKQLESLRFTYIPEEKI